MYEKDSHGRTMPARRSSMVSRVTRGRLCALAILAAEIINHYSNLVVLRSPLPLNWSPYELFGGIMVAVFNQW